MFARWITYLSTFNYTIVHRKGKLQQNADALSRMPGLDPKVEADGLDVGIFSDIADVHALAPQEDNVVSTDVLQRVRKATEADPLLSKIVQWVNDKYTPGKEDRKILTKAGLYYANVLPRLVVQKGALYYTDEAQTFRLCLPEGMRDEDFMACHSHVMCGHIGTNATLTKFKDRFFVPYLRSFVLQKLKTCLPCLKKSKCPPNLTHQQHHEFTSYFGQRLCIDTVGPLNRTVYRKISVHHILTIQDSFTRYLVTVPIENLEAKCIAMEIVEHWVLRFGVPEQIHSDRGTSFTSQLFMETMNMLGIRKIVTPPYCPRGDRVERAHQVLGNILRSDERGLDRDWAIKLPEATLAYNIAANRMTGVSPFEAVFGQKAVLPVDFMFPCQKRNPIRLAHAIENRQSQMSQIVQRMIQNEQKAIQTDARYRPKEISNPVKMGDIVYMFTTRLEPHTSAKLQSRWTGPWEISNIISLSLVELSSIGTWNVRKKTVTTTIDRIHVVDRDSLSRKDLYPEEQVDVDQQGVIVGDEDEGEIIIPYSERVEDPTDVQERVEPLPFSSPKREIEDELDLSESDEGEFQDTGGSFPDTPSPEISAPPTGGQPSMSTAGGSLPFNDNDTPVTSRPPRREAARQADLKLARYRPRPYSKNRPKF